MLSKKNFLIPRAGRYVSVTAEEFAAHQAAQPPPPPKPRGLGDVVALFAEPIARASDAVLGTHLVGCNACAERRAALNRLIPKL
jgi:hypothetical protein